jgi:hypothetical protein
MSYLNKFERKIFSQNGEDGIVAELARLLDPPRFFVEFGVESGIECNTRALKHAGWCGICWDTGNADPERNLYRERITAENINDLFAKYRVPEHFGLLSIDIDGNDYYVWNALDARYRPAIVVIEYNALFPPDQACTIAYDADFCWDKSNYQGASFLALCRLGIRKGYRPVCTDRKGVNLFLVRQDLLAALPSEVVADAENFTTVYHPIGYGGHRPDPQRRVWLPVEPQT